jgi:IS4 transposase
MWQRQPTHRARRMAQAIRARVTILRGVGRVAYAHAIQHDHHRAV